MRHLTTCQLRQPLSLVLSLFLLFLIVMPLVAGEELPAPVAVPEVVAGVPVGNATAEVVTTSAPQGILSRDELHRHVAKLASDEFKGRDSRGEGGILAARYVAEQFKNIGLAPAGDAGGYFQEFTLSQPKFYRWFSRQRSPRSQAVSTSSPGPTTPSSSCVAEEDEEEGASGDEENDPPPMSKEEIDEAAKKLTDWFSRKMGQLEEAEDCQCRNVLALLPGSDPELKDEVVIVSAHYDHLGVRDGEVYNGADDNATGTAAVIELARVLATGEKKPRRSILFAAWDAEEKGLCGSHNWADCPTLPLEQVVAVINLDMLGRMQDDKLFLMGGESSGQLLDLVTARAERAGIRLSPMKARACSDHWPFFEKNVPSITFCTGVHKDYHQPTDDTEWVHFSNMERTVRMTLGIVNELGNRDSRVEFSADR